MSIRDETQDLHDELEQVPFNVRMFQGAQTSDERRAYLAVWDQIFTRLDPHVPDFLVRGSKIAQDLDKMDIIGLDFPRQLVNEYVDTINDDNIDAHIYLNYMGFLYGGQIMKKRYPNSSSMYEFEDLVYARDWVRRQHIPEPLTDDYIDAVRSAFRYHIALSHELGAMGDVE